MSKKAARRPPWEYPHDFADDPAGTQDHKLLESFDGGGASLTEDDLHRMTHAYFQRHVDHVTAWLAANSDAPREQRDSAFAYRVAMERNARTAGGAIQDEYVPLDLQRLYTETKNPLFVWQAISWALQSAKLGNGTDRAASIELPVWCIPMLRQIAAQLVVLGQPGTPRATTANVVKIIGLTSRGSSAFKDRDRRMRDLHKATYVAELVDAGLPVGRARKVGFAKIHNERSRRRASKRVTPPGTPGDKS
jgi:hypothetical protein